MSKTVWRKWAAGISDKHLIAEFEMAVCDRQEADMHGVAQPNQKRHAFAAIRNELFGRLQGRGNHGERAADIRAATAGG